MKTAEDLPRGTAGESPKTGKHAVLPCPSSTGARRTPERVSEGGARARGGWRLLVFGEHFYDFWKKFRDFRGI